MKKILTYTISCFLFSLQFIASAQSSRCDTDHKRNEVFGQNPKQRIVYENLNFEMQDWISSYRKGRARFKSDEKIIINVVVHVIWRLQEENISDDQIRSQFTVLNNDFNLLNSNFNLTPDPFKNIARGINIEFRLASKDPNGNETTGITRTQTSTDNIGDKDYFDPEAGGVASWDVSKYVNIWVCDIGDDGTLGFAFYPGTADPASSDGLVIGYQYFGTTGAAANSFPNHLGRTVTHEMGHYFNLKHIWGDNESGCDSDDDVEDTPNQFESSGGCPAFPTFDQCTDTGDGIMFLNYMDYTDDECMTMFSGGQVERMLAALNGPRKGLWQNEVVTHISDDMSVDVFPNPFSDYITIRNNENAELSVHILNALGQVMITKTIQSGEKNLSTSNLVPGVYYIKIYQGENEKIIRLVR